ncbi:MAG: NUDIX hydrolase [Coprococcus sp.]
MEMFEYLKGRKPKSMDEDSYRQFAVMAAMVQVDGEPHIVFEKRAGGLKRQPGEICLPGGARDGEETAEDNAVRETMEELKVSREQIHVIAQMDTLLTAYDNKVSVFLCELTDYQMTFSETEVAEVFTVPLAFFMETEPEIYVNTVKLITPENFPYDRVPGGRQYHWREGHRNVYFYYYEDKVIWGMTAYIMQGIVKTIRSEAGTVL